MLIKNHYSFILHKPSFYWSAFLFQNIHNGIISKCCQHKYYNEIPHRAKSFCLTISLFNPYSAKGLGDRLYATLHKMPGEVDYSFYFWSRKTLPYTHLEATSYIPQQGQNLHFWTTSLSTTGCCKNKYTIQLLWMACISRFATAILSCETVLALGTIRVNSPGEPPMHFSILILYFNKQQQQTPILFQVV